MSKDYRVPEAQTRGISEADFRNGIDQEACSSDDRFESIYREVRRAIYSIAQMRIVKLYLWIDR